MSSVLTARSVTGGRPGWWRTGFGLAVGGFLGWGALIFAMLPAALLAGVTPWTSDPQDAWRFVPADSAAVAANLGLGIFTLAVLTVVCRWVLEAFVGPGLAPTWVALALALGGFGPLIGEPGTAGAGGFVVGLVVLRFGAFDRDGRARPGLLSDLRGRGRTVARIAVAAVAAFGLAWACAYGVSHPAVAASSSGPLPAVRTPHGPARSYVLDVERRGVTHGAVLGVRAPGDAAGAVRVLAAGTPTFRPGSEPLRGLPMRVPASVEVWLSAPRCPAPTMHVDRLDVRVRSWSGTYWVPLRLNPAARVRCVR